MIILFVFVDDILAELLKNTGMIGFILFLGVVLFILGISEQKWFIIETKWKLWLRIIGLSMMAFVLIIFPCFLLFKSVKTPTPTRTSLVTEAEWQQYTQDSIKINTSVGCEFYAKSYNTILESLRASNSDYMENNSDSTYVRGYKVQLSNQLTKCNKL